MKNKIFSLFGLAVLALLVLTSFASAAVTITVPTDTQFSQSVTDSLTVNYTGATGLTVTPTYTPITDPTGKNIVLSFAPATLGTVTGSFVITSTVPTGFDFGMKQYSTTLTLTEGTTPVTTSTQTLTFAQTDFCAWDGNGLASTTADLTVTIDDVTVTKGFGEDNEWYPEDEVQVDVVVENRNNDNKIRNIVLEWGLFNKKTGKWTIEVSDEKDFDLKDGDEKTVSLKFKLDNLDEDFADLDDGDFVFYARATGDVDETTDRAVCSSASDTASITIESDFVVLSDIQVPETNTCGSQVQVTAEVWNIGDSDQDEVYVLIYNKELGISQKVTIGDIDAFDNAKLDTLISVPQNVEEKSYTLTLSVYDDNGDVYQNSNDDYSKFSTALKVEGGCSTLPLASVSATLQSEAKAGQELVVKATVANTGSVQKTFGIDLAGYEDWASLVSVDKPSISLNSKATADVLITLKVNSDASGEKTLDLLVKDGTKVLSQPVTVVLAEKPSLFSGITGLISGSGKGTNWYLWGIGALNVVLVLVIIFVAVKAVKKK